MADSFMGGGYRIELLKGTNWMPWKRRMTAILRDQNLEEYINPESKKPEPADKNSPTTEERKKIETWIQGDAKARTRIELAIGDSEMIHISGATTAGQMWKQLTQVKESKGRLGILATRRALYRAKAEEGCDMVEHISNMRRLQEELHMMESLVSDEDFVMLLITSLPESWDNYTSSFLGASGNQPTLSSHEFIANLIEEDKRRKGWNDNAGTAMQAGKKKGQAKKASGSGSTKECYNCHKKGHVKADCWNKGGGKEGEGPKG
ncbi:hypothetical protein H1R20_g9148, partial [Candolleomyces eurysporus]